MTDDVIHSALERDGILDFALVFLPMAVFFLLFTYRLSGRIFQRIDGKASATIAALISSVVVSACGVMVGDVGDRCGDDSNRKWPPELQNRRHSVVQ